MSVVENVTVINGKEYKFTHKFNEKERIFEKKVVVAGFGHHPFHVMAIHDHTIPVRPATVTVLPASGQDIDYQIKINCNSRYLDIIDRRKVTTKPIALGYSYLNRQTSFELFFTLKELETKPSNLSADFNRFISNGPIVTLIASDGEVTVSKRLLEIRSPVLEAMFTHDMEESKSMKICLNDFDSKTLQAFCDYLISDEMEGGKTIALGLYLLADKYDVKGLKSDAQKFILDNFKEFDKKQVFDIFSKTDPELFFRILEDKI